MLVRSIALMVLLLMAALPVTGAPLVLFDQGHNERFLIDGKGALDLSNLAGVLTASGLEVQAQSAPLTTEALAGARGLVLSGPFAPLGNDELTVVKRFVEEGGRLVVLLHIGPTVSGLLREFGIVHSNGVIREIEQVLGGEPLNFSVSQFKPHPVLHGLSGFNVYGAWALESDNPLAEVVASSGPKAWVDLNGDKKFGHGDAVQSFGVAVAGRQGRGEFIIFGDDAIFQNRFLVGENETLARNLARWLAE